MSTGGPEPRAMTEDELRAACVGEPPVLDGPVTLAEPDPGWPDRFEREAAEIRRALGDRVMLLEHVGSTSVPWLPAKPIIDMVLAVADSADEASYLPALDAIGYELRIREPDWYEHRCLTGSDPAVNLHVFTAGATEIGRMLDFRNVLRADTAARDRYAATKRELAARRWRYVQDYADAKSQVVEEILASG